MLIYKIGYEHIEKGLNCQDFGVETDTFKCIMDGCSEGKHSEVGVKLFAHLFSNTTMDITECFYKMHTLFPNYEDIRDHMLFTVLGVFESDDYYTVKFCGDGYIIKQKHDDSIEYEKLGDGNTPEYYAYNFVSSDRLNKYKDGVEFKHHLLPKSEYKAVGVASDGLEYILNSPFKEEFERLLLGRKEFAIRRLINREHKYFKDDISIVI